MNLTKLLTLSLLALSSLVSAQVRFQAQVDLNSPEVHLESTVILTEGNTVILSKNESNYMSMHLEQELEDKVLVTFEIATFDKEGNVSVISEPALLINYEEKAWIKLSKRQRDGHKIREVYISFDAQKI